MEKIFRNIFLLFISWTAITNVAAAEPDFPVWYDLAFFKFNQKSQVYCELYISVDIAKLTQSKEKPEVGYSANLRITSGNDEKSVVDEKWNQHKTLVTTAEKGNEVILDQVSFVLAPGSYVLNLQLKDLYSERIAAYQDSIVAPAFATGTLALSDVQLCNNIEAAKGAAAFTKNGLTVVPHPTRLYGSHLPYLFFYAEAYNIDIPAGAAQSLQAEYNVQTLEGRLIQKFPPQQISVVDHSAQLASRIKVEELPAGHYNLALKVSDLKSGQTAEAKTIFHVYQPPQPLIANNEPMFTIPELTEVSEKEYYSEALYHLTDRDKKLYNTLILEGKRQFLIDFWIAKDPTPETEINEFYLENKRRVLIADQEFKYGVTPGWKTDRGRVFILYGPPNEIQRESMSKEYAPNIIWIYNDLENVTLNSERVSDYALQEDITLIQGKSPYFVFAQMNNDGKNTLVHSNVVGEVQDMDWRRRIRKFSGRKPGAMSDQVKEYLGGKDPTTGGN